MIGDVASQDHMFVRDIDTRNPPTNAPVTNTGASSGTTGSPSNSTEGGNGSQDGKTGGSSGAISLTSTPSFITMGVLVLGSLLL